jgi:protein O-GlcNAc transferase
MNRWQEAIDSYERALKLEPENARIKLALCIGQLPVIYEDEATIEIRRKAYELDLQKLCEDSNDKRRLAELAQAVGTYMPFYLAYQGRNDCELQSRYGALVCRAMAEQYGAVPLAQPPAPGEPVRVGIVTGYFCQHSVWKAPTKGWLAGLDRSRFRVFGYHTGSIVDGETEVAAELCERFVQGPKSIEQWRDMIVADAPHVLLYPDINMDPPSGALAALRLAPVQCSSWGHPETSGYPTIDFFLSSDLMEPPDGQEHYTETLVRLPNLSIYYDPIDTQLGSRMRADLGLRAGATVFWCGQSLFKYLPRYDEVYPRIARVAPDCQFAFIDHPKGRAATVPFWRRLERIFAAHGLYAAWCCRACRSMISWQQSASATSSSTASGGQGSIRPWRGYRTTFRSLLWQAP